VIVSSTAEIFAGMFQTARKSQKLSRRSVDSETAAYSELGEWLEWKLKAMFEDVFGPDGWLELLTQGFIRRLTFAKAI